jgi:MFS family permease
MEISGENRRAVFRIIFAASFASLSHELALMRIFSISLWYHFAFMVISIAMLGIGASGSALTVLPGLKDIRRVPIYALLLAIGIPASYLVANLVPFDPARLSWDRVQLLAIGLYYVVLCIPFFCFGLIVSTAYSTLSHDANAIYAADLLGAGTGALAMVWFLSLGGPETSMLILSVLLATTLLYRPIGWVIRLASLLLIAVSGIVLFLSPSFFQPRISPYKPFSLALQFPGAEHVGTAYSPYSRVDLFKSPAVRFAPGLSFTYLDPLPEQTGIAVDAGDIYAMTDETDRKKLAFIRSLPSSLAYEVQRNRDVLIIEPRAGLALLTARLFGVETVSAIDSNPLVLRVMREYGRTHATPVYEHQVWSGLARTWLAGTDRAFDLIDLSLMGSWPAAAFGFAEDYRFTVEAFEQYLGHLKPEGILSLNLYIIPPPRTELRLLATLARSAEASGITDMPRHVAAVRSWDTLTVLMKRSPLTAEDIRRIKVFAHAKRFDLVYYPGIRPEESNVYVKQPGNDYAEAFRRLVNWETRDRFMADYLFDISPVSDESPFFHYYLKIENMRAIYRVMGKKWQYFIEEGYLLPVLAGQVLIVSAVLILLPLVKLRVRQPAITGKDAFRTLSFFAFLGIAYLFVEVAFIQKMILSLENPSYAASTVIASLLISSGIGSALAGRMRSLNGRRVLLVLAGLLVLYGLLLPGIIGMMSHYPLMIKIVLSFVVIMPAGIFMGIPFPFGVSAVGSSAPDLISWAWAVNGCFSVIAPVLAVMLALSTGYQFVLLSAAAMYLLAFFAIQQGPERGEGTR